MLIPIAMAIIGYLAALVIGFPTYSFLKRKGIDSFPAYLVAGVLIGFIVYVLLCFGVLAEEAARILLAMAVTGAVIACYAALFIGMIGIPIYSLLQRKGINGFSACLIVGALIGFISLVLGYGIFTRSEWQMSTKVVLLVGSLQSAALELFKVFPVFGIPAIVCSMISSVIFWLIAIRKPGKPVHAGANP
ncbi:hypothetical protein D5047_22865 [Verminephrobacter eiseniae]|nr:hypothetical protein [Verminephrobacter eiseniae]